MRTEKTESICLDDLRHCMNTEMNGCDRAMILIADALNAKLNPLGIYVQWINVFDAEANPG